MPLTPKQWQNLPETTSPIDAAALIDLETRLGAHADSRLLAGTTMAQPPNFRLELLDPDPIATGTAAVGLSLYWFCPMRVKEILGGAALDDYYAWESTDHDNDYAPFTHPGGIFLRTAPSPLGPWSARTLLFQDSEYPKEAETPSVIYRPDDPNGRPFYCYYQESDGATQFTRLRSHATGDTNTGWVQETCRNMFGPIAAPNGTRLALSTTSNDLPQLHTGYLNVFAHGSGFGGFSRIGGVDPQSFGRWHSQNGKDWVCDPRLLRFNTRLTGAPDKWLAYTQFNPFRWAGQLYTLSTIIQGANRNPVIVPLGDDLRTITGPPREILTVTQGWESLTGVRHIRPFADRGELYVYITYDKISTGVYRLVG